MATSQRYPPVACLISPFDDSTCRPWPGIAVGKDGLDVGACAFFKGLEVELNEYKFNKTSRMKLE